MKRKFLCLLLALTMVLGLAATAMATPNTEYDVEEDEFNSTFAAAQPIKLGQTYSGMAWLNRDVDLFRLTLDEAKEIRLSAFVDDDPINPVEIVLFDAAGKMLAKAVNVGTNWDNTQNEYLIFPIALKAGEYYVGICVTGKLNDKQSVGQNYYFEVNEGVYPCGGYHRAFFGHVITPATCVSDGEKLMTCPCGATETAVIPTDSEAHTWATTVLSAPTCTEEGSAHRVCTGCALEEDLVLMSNHDALWEEETLKTEFASSHRVILQEPTADDYGFYEVYCDDCGELIWEESPISPLEHSFIDVEEGSFCDVPVAWAVYKEITNGIDSFRFSPADKCNRAQAVTFLWSAAGKPEPTITSHPFTDVPAGSFCEKAVLWALEKNITSGTDETHFSPLATCNRATIVTFLYKALGSPELTAAENPFEDIPDESWYTAPVLWAKEAGITSGTDATHFSPASLCNRAQMVTFLYSAYNK